MTWKTIESYSDYQVSDTGKVRSFKQKGKRILKPCTNTRGYYYVDLSMNGAKENCRIHKLVAAAFMGICPEGKEVNHRNGTKTDNRLENLEYVTRSQNHFHAFQNGLMVPNGEKKVQQFTTDGTPVAEYKSQMGAGRETGVNFRNISACCLGKRKTAGGFVWRQQG